MVHLIRFAYLDAGTGSMVIQSIIGVAAGIGLFGRKALTSVRARKHNKSTAVKKESNSAHAK